MRRITWGALTLALAAFFIMPRAASAEIIDFDPRFDEVPDIVDTEALEKWESLFNADIRRHSIVGVTPDGTKALLQIFSQEVSANVYEVYDVAGDSFEQLDLPERWSLFGTLHWTGDQQAIGFGRQINEQGNDVEGYGILTFDLVAGEVTKVDAIIPEGNVMWGPNPFYAPNTMIDGEDDIWIAAIRAESQVDMLHFERPRYDEIDPLSELDGPPVGAPRPLDTLDDLPLEVSQQAVELIVFRAADGAVTSLGELEPGVTPWNAVFGMAMRPTGDTVAWVEPPSLPWNGEIINRRSNRGGGMPSGYWNVQENLGNIPEDENLWVTRTRLVLHNLETGERAALENSDYTPGRFVNTMWTSDGSHLVVMTSMPSVLEGREHPIYEYARGIALSVFTPDLERVAVWEREGFDANGVSFRPLGGTRFAVMTLWNTTRHVYTVDVTMPDELPTPVYTGDRIPIDWDFKSGTLMAMLAASNDPGELHLGTKSGDGPIESLSTLTDFNEGLRSASNVAYTNVPYVTSDGVELVGTYVYPADWTMPPAEPQPVVVWQAGGPGGQIVNFWGTGVESPYTLLPSLGIPVFLVNGAGRLSNGSAQYSAMADGTNFGERDIREVKEGVEALIDMGYVDADAVGVTGCSYGGYFTLQSLTTYPDFYAAGNSQCSLNDMMYEFHFGWSPFLAYLIGDTPTGNPAEYIADSPTYNAHKIRTPLLQFHGTNDFLFFEHITNIHDQVEMNDVPSRFFRAINYGHGIGGLVNTPNAPREARTMGQRYAFQLQLEWFREHLGITDGAGGSEPLRSIGDLMRPIILPGLPQGEVRR